MPTVQQFGRTFDARPDRIDFRDLAYRARLVSLPPAYPDAALITRFLPLYGAQGMVLDQGNEGACTGFGLAAVVNYLRWESANSPVEGSDPVSPPSKVSPRMLYQNARLYDEWKGEDYDGSSCRGAMKGLHKHGVCSETLWPYRAPGGKPGQSGAGWDQDAARCPLGAYYRIDARSLVDMQAAIYEVHAIYVSGSVHGGWKIGRCKSIDDAIIPAKKPDDKLGGHAFALVGYTEDGFIVQNSWGKSWGYNGFAILPYADWSEHGQDAWVLALGAPMHGMISPPARTDVAFQDRASTDAIINSRAAAVQTRHAVSPWTDGKEAGHCVFIGHNGHADRELVAAIDAADAVRRVVEEGVKSTGLGKVAIYMHGGLNNRTAGLRRARVLGPWLLANGIHPIFVIWQTGFLESAGDIIHNQIDRLGPEAEAKRVEGWVLDLLKEAKDRGFETVARDFGVKAIWENMKFRADGASGRNGALAQVAASLNAIRKAAPATEIHLLGHSAGAILMGYFLGQLEKKSLAATTAHLWAPAITLPLARSTFGRAFRNKVLDAGTLHVGLLSDENERSDACVPVAYSKSLLYLVSRALEPDHKTPVMGLQKAWRAWMPPKHDDMFSPGALREIQEWSTIAEKVVVDPPVATAEVPNVRLTDPADGRLKVAVTIKADHGSFDNNLDAVNLAIARILRADSPTVRVTSLQGY